VETLAHPPPPITLHLGAGMHAQKWRALLLQLCKSGSLLVWHAHIMVDRTRDTIWDTLSDNEQKRLSSMLAETDSSNMMEDVGGSLRTSEDQPPHLVMLTVELQNWLLLAMQSREMNMGGKHKVFGKTTSGALTWWQNRSSRRTRTRRSSSLLWQARGGQGL